MSIEDGFKAVDSIKRSSEKLSDTIIKIEELERKLSELDALSTDLKSLLEDSPEVFLKLTEGVDELAAAKTKITKAVGSLPSLTSKAVEAHLRKLLSEFETKMNNRWNQELKETRTTLREAFENHANRMEKVYENSTKKIIEEMPRTIFGKRGKS